MLVSIINSSNTKQYHITALTLARRNARNIITRRARLTVTLIAITRISE